MQVKLFILLNFCVTFAFLLDKHKMKDFIKVLQDQILYMLVMKL